MSADAGNKGPVKTPPAAVKPGATSAKAPEPAPPAPQPSGPSTVDPSAGAQNRYRRSAGLEQESPPVEILSKEPEEVSAVAAPTELVREITDTEPPQPEQQPPSQSAVWRATLLSAGAERLEALTDSLLEIGGEVEGVRNYVTRIGDGRMAHVGITVRIRKG